MKIEKICQYHCIKDNEHHILENSTQKNCNTVILESCIHPLPIIAWTSL